MSTPAQPQRVVFGQTLVELAAEMDRIVVLDADVSCSTQTRLFGQAYPDRFFNVGIAEAHMVSMAAGLATTGYIPFVSTFALFIAMRAGDQVRSQIAYPRLNVKLVGGYAGLSDFADGASHQSVEDIAVMRAIPNITVIAPSDITETRMAIREAARMDGPVYLRLSREAISEVFDATHPFRIGEGIEVRAGTDLTIAATGTTVPMAMAAAERMRTEGVSCRVLDMHTIKPLDEKIILRAARETGALVTVEEASCLGGFGSAVCETVCASCPVPVIRVGLADCFGESGTYCDILSRAGIDEAHIIDAANRARAAKSSSLVSQE